MSAFLSPAKCKASCGRLSPVQPGYLFCHPDAGSKQPLETAIFHPEFSAALHGHFEVETKDYVTEQLLTPEIRFSFLFNYPGTTLKLAESFVLSLMPKSISHYFILKDLKREIGELIDRHCGRAREDFTRRILESERQQKQWLDERIVTVVEVINSAIERAKEMKEKSTAEGEKRLSILEECRKRLDKVAASLEAQNE